MFDSSKFFPSYFEPSATSRHRNIQSDVVGDAEQTAVIMEETPVLKFQPFSSAVDVSFWQALSRNKVETYKLSDEAVSICGSFSSSTSFSESGLVRSAMRLDASSFEEKSSVPTHRFPCHGTLYNTNTIEDFRAFDKKGAMSRCAEQIWEDIVTCRTLKDANLLSRFALISFADIKNHRYVYWFAFPALVPKELRIKANPPLGVSVAFVESEVESLQTSFKEFYMSFKKDRSCPAYFLIAHHSGGDAPGTGAEAGTGTALSVHTIDQWDLLHARNDVDEVLLGVVDPCDLAPGWPLRNFLFFAAVHWKVTRTRVVCLRDIQRDLKSSIVASVSIEGVNLAATPSPAASASASASGRLPSVPSVSSLSSQEASGRTDVLPPCPRAIGWERDANGKLAARQVDLKAQADPKVLAASSVDLNLKLMKWNVMPDLDLERIATTKCLLIGAGTLGCAVARNLMAWGIRHITFVDNGRVSYSNPVRQSLFSFKNSVDNLPKAECAANSLAEIFPGVTATGHLLSIPMPGHSVGKKELKSVKRDVETIHALVAEHDAVFLLTDSRESRWLPTMLGAYENKLVINSALGFATYVVMRHGVNPSSSSPSSSPPLPEDAAAAAAEHLPPSSSSSSSVKLPADNPHERLACYFCSDVVAPRDSLKDRSLDQQCTVTRPGLAHIAGAMASELLLSVLSHPLRSLAPASHDQKAPLFTTGSKFGLVPHQIRGSVTHFSSALMTGFSYDRCTACSKVVLEEYRTRGWEFVLDAFNKPAYLEDLTGLSQVQSDSVAAWDDDDFDSDSDALASQASGVGVGGDDALVKPVRSSSHTLSDVGGHLAGSSSSSRSQTQTQSSPRTPPSRSGRNVEEEDLLDIGGLSLSSPSPPQEDSISSRTRSRLASGGPVDLVTNSSAAADSSSNNEADLAIESSLLDDLISP